MSNHLTSEVYKRRIGSLSRNAVLVLMADKASDDGSGIWASKQRMADELGCSKQTVIEVIKSLMADGLVRECGHRRNANGYTVEYEIDVAALHRLPLVPHHQSSSLTGQEAAPVKPVDPTSQAALPHQSSSLTQTSLNHPEPPREGRAQKRAAAADPVELDQGGEAAAPAAGGGKPHPLPADWEPPAVGDLPPETAALVRQWPAGAYLHFSANFRDHWASVDRKKRTASGHAGAFRNWLRRVHPEAMRAAKFGLAYVDAVIRPAVPRQVPPPVRAQADQGENGAAILAELRRTTPAQTFDQWIANCAFLPSGAGLVVVVPTAFAGSWLENNLKARIEATAATLTGDLPEWVRFDVEDKSGQPTRSGRAHQPTQGTMQHG